MRYFFSLLLLILIPVLYLQFEIPYAHGSGCSTYSNNSSIPAGFGAPYNLFSTTREMLITVNCDSSGVVSVTVGNGSDQMYLYEKGYEWDGTKWNQYVMTGTKTGEWILGKGTGTFTKPVGGLGAPNYLVAYTCLWNGAAWKCGCMNVTCATPAWQLQGYQLAGTPGPGSSLVEVEAESGTLSGAVVVSNTQASGGSGVQLNNPGDSVQIPFTVPSAGDYVVWGRVLAATTNSDSTTVQIDTGVQDAWHFVPNRTNSTNNFIWDQVSYVGTGSRTNPQNDPMVVTLTQGSHALTLTQREPNTIIDKLIITKDRAFVPQGGGSSSSSSGGSTSGSTSGGSTSGSTSGGGGKNIPAGYVKDARDHYWESQGYQLYWTHTPTDADLNLTAKQYFETRWNGEHPITNWEDDPSSGRVTMDRAPDGTPALKGDINKGDKDLILRVWGHQLGPDGIEADIVATMDWYNPCNGGYRPNNKSGYYTGLGHIWGSRPGVTHVPHSSINFDDAWSFRVPLGSTRPNWSVYFYIPIKPDIWGRSSPSNTLTTDYGCNKWITKELEIIQNDVDQNNARFRLFIEGDKALDVGNFKTRIYPDVRPKGHGVFIKHNSGPLNREITYMNNWKLYVRPR